jgi:hypothetical protein
MRSYFTWAAEATSHLKHLLETVTDPKQRLEIQTLLEMTNRLEARNITVVYEFMRATYAASINYPNVKILIPTEEELRTWILNGEVKL